MAVGIGGVLVSGVRVGPIVKRLGERSALLLALASETLGFAVQGWAPGRMWFWAAIPLINLWSLCGPAMKGLMVPRVGASAQGQLQAHFGGCGACARS